MNRRVLELAQTDILTGLPNQAFFLEQPHDVNSYERRDRGRSILMLDLDRFKNVNDLLGHAAGDELLRRGRPPPGIDAALTDVLARGSAVRIRVIRGRVRRSAAAVRLDLAARISKLIAEPFQLPGHRVRNRRQYRDSIGARARQRAVKSC